MKYVRNDGGRAASKHDEINDCACRAIAIATERPYHEIWAAFKELLDAEGPKRASGVSEKVQNEVLTSLGWEWVHATGKRLQEGDLPMGRLVVCIHGHSVAVINGVIHDTYNPARRGGGGPPFVRGYYRKGVAVAPSEISPDQKKVLDAVTKILALAEGTSYKAEAETARAKAAELIAKYDITADSMKDLEGFKSEVEFRTGDLPSYEFSLLAILGRFCGVLVLSTSRQHGGRNLILFGKPQDIGALHYLRDVVFSQMNRAWSEYLAVNPGMSRKAVSWKNSFADGVEAKIKALMKVAQIKQKALRKDLVLVPRERQAHEKWETLFGKLGSGYGYGGESNAHGLAAGKSVSLSSGGVGSTGPVKRIGR